MADKSLSALPLGNEVHTQDSAVERPTREGTEALETQRGEKGALRATPTSPSTAEPIPEPRNHVSEADQVRRTLSLLRSIIQSGERWTPGAQMEYGAALVSLDWLEREGKS